MAFCWHVILVNVHFTEVWPEIRTGSSSFTVFMELTSMTLCSWWVNSCCRSSIIFAIFVMPVNTNTVRCEDLIDYEQKERERAREYLVPGSWCMWSDLPWIPPPQPQSDIPESLYTHGWFYGPDTRTHTNTVGQFIQTHYNGQMWRNKDVKYRPQPHQRSGGGQKCRTESHVSRRSDNLWLEQNTGRPSASERPAPV